MQTAPSNGMPSLSVWGLLEPGSTDLPPRVDLMQGIRIEEIIEGLEKTVVAGEAPADTELDGIRVQRAVSMMRVLHKRLQHATFSLARTWGVDALVSQEELSSLESELELVRAEAHRNAVQASAVRQQQAEAALKSVRARTRWQQALIAVLRQRIASSRMTGSLKFALIVLAATQAKAKNDQLLHEKRKDLIVAQQRARNAADSTQTMSRRMEELADQGEELQEEKVKLEMERESLKHAAEEKELKIRSLEERLQLAAGFEDPLNKRNEQLVEDRLARLEADMQKWRWKAEQSQLATETMKKDLRRVYESHHKLGASNAAMAEANEKERERVRIAEAAIARLTEELDVERRISNERLGKLVEERRSKRVLREDLAATSSPQRDPIGSPAPMHHAPTPSSDPDQLFPVEAVKDLLLAAATGGMLESPRQPLPALPIATKKTQRRLVEHEQALAPPAYVARGLTNSHSMPPAMMPIAGAARRSLIGGRPNFVGSASLIPGVSFGGRLQHPSMPKSGGSLSKGGGVWRPPASGAFKRPTPATASRR